MSKKHDKYPIREELKYVVDFYSNIIKSKDKRITELESICHRLQDDLLMRAETSSDGTRAVNVSNSIWNKFCRILDKTTSVG